MVPTRHQARTMARGLGWFSIAVGLAELIAARPLSRAVGLPGRADAIRAYGMREIATGIGLRRTAVPERWMWARVAGDALDIATLAAGLRHNRAGATIALASVAGVAALDLMCARRLSQPRRKPQVDYRDRSGFPRPPAQMRGAALKDFHAPADMRAPALLRPWSEEKEAPQSSTTTTPASPSLPQQLP